MTLKITAEGEVLVAADRVVAALHTVVHTTTESVAVAVAQRAAADEVNNFSNAVRREIGKTEYTPERSKKAVNSFLDVLARQTDDFVETAREEMLAQGFGSTPWDNYERKTPKIPPMI
ncbi:MAG: hypothetical protein HYZ38_21995 [Mycobacterium sp.]|nr:hypothetical protein [Mycobacterium sp.]